MISNAGIHPIHERLPVFTSIKTVLQDLFCSTRPSPIEVGIAHCCLKKAFKQVATDKYTLGGVALTAFFIVRAFRR